MAEVHHGDTPLFDSDLDPAFYDHVDELGFALLNRGDFSPHEGLVEEVRALGETSVMSNVIITHVWGRFEEIDRSLEAAGREPIQSKGTEIHVKVDSINGGGVHIDRPHRDTRRDVEVMQGERRWGLWAPDPRNAFRPRRVKTSSGKPDFVVIAEPGDRLVLQARLPWQSRREARATSVPHSYHVASQDGVGLSLMYARRFPYTGALSRLRYRTAKTPDFIPVDR